jgi:hypothetical protein|nr:MAG TPA: hypothetical protein [Caudoviricetes sp.]
MQQLVYINILFRETYDNVLFQWGNEFMSKEQENLMNRIKKISEFDDTSRQYEVDLTHIANKKMNIKLLENILKDPFNDSQYSNDNILKIKYATFYCVNIYHRHQFNKEILDKLWETYADQFKEFKSFNHLKVNRFLLESDLCSDLDKQKDILEKASNDAVKYPNNAGYQHAFAVLFVDIVEKNEQNFEQCRELIETWNSKAFTAINSAIQRDSEYARYYCTKGRILSLMGRYDEADEQIYTAIIKEDSTKVDYAIRISKYQYYKIQNQYKKQLNDLQTQIKNEQEEISRMNNSVISNIETITLFSGIVSFVLGSLHLADGSSTVHAALLIVILMSCLMIVFVAFILLLHSSNKKFNKKSCYFLLIFSIVVIIMAIIIMGVLNDKYHICFFRTRE